MYLNLSASGGDGMRMKSLTLTSLLLLAACGGTEGTRLRPFVPGTVIAETWDDGTAPSFLTNGRAAIVYDPDGCQHWIIDDGEEGYSTPRSDPHTGLPVCDNRYPPGTVIGDIERPTDEIPDFVPDPRQRPAD
jgi:hypothetical protein